jgi:hypothetical protein
VFILLSDSEKSEYRSRVNSKFCVKLGRSAIAACAVLCEACGGGVEKLSSIKMFREGKRMWKILKEVFM